MSTSHPKQETIFKQYIHEVLPYVSTGIRMWDTSLDLWLQRMMVCFGDVQGKAILDYGSGSGHKAIFLARQGALVTAIEINPEDIQRIQSSIKQAGVSLRICEGGTETLAEFPDASFDCILLSEVIEHLPLNQVDLFRKQLARILRPSGKLFLATPNRVFYGPAEESKEYYLRQAYGHHKHYTMQELKNLFGPPDFQTHRVYFETHPLTLWRNRLFYPVARYQYAIQHGRRFPLIRFIGKPFAYLIHWIWKICYPLFRYIHHAYENSHVHQEATGLTLMLDIERL